MKWMIYGANGYTGKLIAKEAKNRGLTPVLAGRDENKIKPLAEHLEMPYQIFSLNDIQDIANQLNSMSLVLNCAGPFSQTSHPFIEACIQSQTHYLDITGEISVFENAQAFNQQAIEASVIICPGVGFDVIPTDCIANTLKKALPDATELYLGFDSSSPLSPGTAKTAIEGLGDGGKIRKNGQIITVPLAHKTRSIDFGRGKKLAMTIPWGDISTAYFSTKIPNIEVYVPVSQKQIYLLKSLNYIRWLFDIRWVKDWLKKKTSSQTGPNEKQLEQQSTWVWGEAKNSKGQIKTARIQTSNGYALTVDGSLMTVEFVLKNNIQGGYTTPALLLGIDAINHLSENHTIELQ